jgi:DNA-binding response OmpR family regulator
MINAQSIEVRSLSLQDEEVKVLQEKRAGAWSYRMKLGRETIWLNSVEYRILAFLAQRPYHAFTRNQIADGVSTDRNLVEADTLHEHIASLRDKLGFFRDYIQTVPHTGYRFKE